jgi:hypothetical protein
VTIWQVRQIWAASDFKRHRLRTFKTSNDPVFAEKVIDVGGLYLNPPNNAIVLSVDKKTQIQALGRTFFLAVPPAACLLKVLRLFCKFVSKSLR